MNACASAAMLAAGLLLAAAAHAQPIELDGIELSRDVPCLGKDVNISGNANKISLTGDCGVVQVYGTDHEISLEKASALEVSGIGNSVTAKSVDRLTVDTNKNHDPHHHPWPWPDGNRRSVGRRAWAGTGVRRPGAGHCGWHRQPLAVERG